MACLLKQQRRLPFIVCQLKETHLVFRLYIWKTELYILYTIQVYPYTYAYTYTYKYKYILPFQTENGSPDVFLLSVYRLHIVKTEVCRLSVCWRRTDGSYPFAHRLNGLNRRVHLWFYNVDCLTVACKRCRLSNLIRWYDGWTLVIQRLCMHCWDYC